MIAVESTSFDKPAFQIRTRNHALIFLTENAVTESCDQVVDRVADESGHKTEIPQKRNSLKAGSYAQRSVALLIQTVIFKQENGMQDGGIETEAFHDIRAIGGLKRSEPEILLLIATKHELHGTITKIADTIEKNNRACVSFLHVLSEPSP